MHREKKVCVTTSSQTNLATHKKKLQIVVLNSIPEKNTHLRGWRQKNFLLSDKKALLSAVVLLQNVGVYTVDKEKCGWRVKKVD
jgi:hypothetical protein